MRSFAALGLFVLAGLAGCSKGAGTPTTPQASVSGSVTNDGKPVTLDSSVVFFCQEQGATAAGKIDSLGKFSLSAADKKLGIPAGRYQVGFVPPTRTISVDSPEYKDFMMGKLKIEQPKDIPAKFHNYQQSGIVLEVKAGENTFDFDLAKLDKK